MSALTGSGLRAKPTSRSLWSMVGHTVLARAHRNPSDETNFQEEGRTVPGAGTRRRDASATRRVRDDEWKVHAFAEGSGLPGSGVARGRSQRAAGAVVVGSQSQ